MAEQTPLPPATAEPVITEPNAYTDLPEAVYHNDPIEGGSLSSTGARKLIAPGCPAKYRWWADNREPFKAVFEEGKAAHRKVLGVGPELVLVDRARWDTNEVKAQLAEIRERGDVPLKKPAMEMVDAMAKALREDPIASTLLDPGQGDTELSLFWRERSVWGRSRLDRLTKLRSGRPAIVEYKSCASAAPADVEKSMARFGYHIQGGFQRAGAIALGLVPEDVAFLIVAQEKEPPYLTTVVEPDFTAMRMAEIRVRQAFDLFAECMAAGKWPGYTTDVWLAQLPPWETRELNGEVW